ncbi:MAG: hypothetical protein LBL19_05470, partial [Spirochaetaceae bacterium]|jgi:hypothetical protein|nr:hypothetical protein [Spirochaetaceae bacterium]
LVLGIAAFNIITGINKRQRLAEQEFANLVNLSSAAGTLGEPFKETLRETLKGSQTLQAVIFSSPLGEETFEKEPGRAIAWVGGTPRFKAALGLSKEPFFRPVDLDGIRNANIRAVFSYLGDEGLVATLKYSLVAVLSALAIACFTLITEYIREQGGIPVKAGEEESPPNPPVREQPAAEAAPETAPAPETGWKIPPVDKSAYGLYSPHGIGWEFHAPDRLSAELRRCAAENQDLVYVTLEFQSTGEINELMFNQFTGGVLNYFTHRDLIFQKGEWGISVIIPHTDLAQGFKKATAFHTRLMHSLSRDFQDTRFCIGLSSRAGRLVEVERLIFESEKALEKAREDPASPVVAFKIDPEKYQSFMASKNKKRP